jgi:hypothetical protein
MNEGEWEPEDESDEPAISTSAAPPWVRRLVAQLDAGVPTGVGRRYADATTRRTFVGLLLAAERDDLPSNTEAMATIDNQGRAVFRIAGMQATGLAYVSGHEVEAEIITAKGRIAGSMGGGGVGVISAFRSLIHTAGDGRSFGEEYPQDAEQLADWAWDEFLRRGLVSFLPR